MAAWTLLFHYESLRHHYLQPWLGRELPKLKFLFPPAGWIMFFRVDKADGRAEVYGFRPAGPGAEAIDPHRIFATRWVGYDNIRRNILVTTLDPRLKPAFCAYLRRKFPEFGDFAVVQVVITDVTRDPKQVLRQRVYSCGP